MKLKTDADSGTYLEAEEYLYLGNDLPGQIEVSFLVKVLFDYDPPDPETNFLETITLGDMEIPDIPNCPIKNLLISKYMEEYKEFLEEAAWELLHNKRIEDQDLDDQF